MGRKIILNNGKFGLTGFRDIFDATGYLLHVTDERIIIKTIEGLERKIATEQTPIPGKIIIDDGGEILFDGFSDYFQMLGYFAYYLGPNKRNEIIKELTSQMDDDYKLRTKDKVD